KLGIVAQALDLRDDPQLIAEYRDWHARVWPEVIDALRGIGIAQMRIFLAGNRLFMYAEAPDDFDPAAAYQRYASTPRAREWDRMMRRYQAPIPGAPEDAWWTPMEMVFDLADAPRHR
ncbi:MAG: L-rhamnose mutarotase, partial [Chloroflexi bacterium]|nr:L-rhamnose mutarotase [Chloroflexota bacterium]